MLRVPPSVSASISVLAREVHGPLNRSTDLRGDPMPAEGGQIR